MIPGCVFSSSPARGTVVCEARSLTMATDHMLWGRERQIPRMWDNDLLTAYGLCPYFQLVRCTAPTEASNEVC